MKKTFEERVSKFALKYGNAYLESVGYFKTYWLGRYKEIAIDTGMTFNASDPFLLVHWYSATSLVRYSSYSVKG